MTQIAANNNSGYFLLIKEKRFIQKAQNDHSQNKKQNYNLKDI